MEGAGSSSEGKKGNARRPLTHVRSEQIELPVLCFTWLGLLKAPAADGGLSEPVYVVRGSLHRLAESFQFEFGSDFRMLRSDGYEHSAGVAGWKRSIRRFNQTYDCDSISLRDWPQFKSFLNERAMLVLERPELQYLAVEGVSATDLEQIDYLRMCLELPQMRILHDEDEGLLIVKLMPGRPHEAAIDLFRELFIAQVPSSLGIFGLGAARCGETTRRRKEADQAYIPENRISHQDWPTVVVEIGVSNSLAQLREDARYWLTNSGGQVFVVILISLSFSTKVVTWEWWENAPAVAPATGVQTRGQIVALATGVPTLMQTVLLPPAGPATGTPFRIPTCKIWDIVPPNVGTEIVFTAQQLETYSINLRRFF